MSVITSLGRGQSLRKYATCVTDVLLLEVKCKMLRRAKKPEESDLTSTGAFIDTAGEGKKKGKRRMQIEASADTEEEELEALVFGGQPFKRTEVFSEEHTDESEEVNSWKKSVVRRVIV